MKYKSSHLDLLGMTASLLCAVHCAALPLILGATAFGGIHILADPFIEHLILYLSLGIAFLSLVYSYRNQHGRELPMLLAGSGFVLIIGVHVFHEQHGYYLLAFGGLLVAIAHLINYQWTRACSVRSVEAIQPQDHT